MHPHTILTKLQSSLELDPSQMFALWTLAETQAVDKAHPCTRTQLAAFLEALIVQKRGPRPEGQSPNPVSVDNLDNNSTLKKIRIALELKEDAVTACFAKGGVILGKYELSAMARKQGHKHYKECTDEQLSAFLDGLKA